MEQNNNHFMGFEEEQYFLNKWIDKNIKPPNLLAPIWGSYYEVVEEELSSILDDLEFYALYIESGPNNGFWNVFLIGYDGAEWIQSCWENGHKIALEKSIFRDNWSRRICNFRFSDDIVVDPGKYIVLDADSIYLFITCHDRLKRFAVHHPRTMVYWDSDDRYIRQIQRMIRHIKRNYLWIQLFQRKRSA